MTTDEPTALAELLQTLEHDLKRIGVPLDQNLAPGVDESTVRSRLEVLGLTAPDELVTWFGWRNGIVTPQGQLGASVLPTIVPASLDWACSAYSIGRESTEPMWSFAEGWFPLEQLGHSLCVDTRRDPTFPPVVRRADEEHPLDEARDHRQVVSLTTPVSWWLDGIRSGALEWIPQSVSWKVHYPRLLQEQLESGMF